MARNGGAKKIAVNGIYLISVLRLKHFDLIADALPFGRLWYAEPDAISNAICYAKFYSRSHDAVIRVFDEAGNVIENARARTTKRFPRRDARQQSRSFARENPRLRRIFLLSKYPADRSARSAQPPV
jgi:hypothetical protein